MMEIDMGMEMEEKMLIIQLRSLAERGARISRLVTMYGTL